MNYESHERGVCPNGGLKNPCTLGGSSNYTAGKTYNDIVPTDEGVSNTTTFGLFKIEWVMDDQYDGIAGVADPTDPADTRFLPENELKTGSQLCDGTQPENGTVPTDKH